MSHNVPKAVLYYSPLSIWSSAVRLTLVEKGYGEDELDLKAVDLIKGENFGPQFLRLNPKATVPTLVVPLDKTLSEEIESRYKAIAETKDIIEFLDKSRSPLSRTHTTSDAPAPSLAAATIAFAAISKTVVEEIIHSEVADPTNLMYMNARDDASLRELSKVLLPILKGKQEALSRHLSDAESGTTVISDKVKAFWRTKKMAIETFLDVFEKAEKSTSDLDANSKAKRAEYFATAKSGWEVGLPKILTQLNEQIIGPFTLGEQISIADLHVTAWLARVAKLAGATVSDDGNGAVEKIEKAIGTEFKVPRIVLPVDLMKMEGDRPVSRSKLAALWDTMRERASWKKVYADGLV